MRLVISIAILVIAFAVVGKRSEAAPARAPDGRIQLFAPSSTMREAVKAYPNAWQIVRERPLAIRHKASGLECEEMPNRAFVLTRVVTQKNGLHACDYGPLGEEAGGFTTLAEPDRNLTPMMMASVMEAQVVRAKAKLLGKPKAEKFGACSGAVVQFIYPPPQSMFGRVTLIGKQGFSFSIMAFGQTERRLVAVDGTARGLVQQTLGCDFSPKPSL